MRREELAAMLGIEGLGVAQELPYNQSLIRGRHHKVGQFANIANCVVDVPANPAFTARI